MVNTSAASHSSLHPVGGDPPSGCGFALPAGARLAFGPQRVLSGYPCGVHPRSAYSRRASRRCWRVSCRGVYRFCWRPLVLSAGSGTSAWPSSSLPFPSFRGSCGGWRCRGGCSFSSPHYGKPRCSSPAFSRFQRCVRRVFQAYCGRRGPALRGPVCEGLAILQDLPARFLRSSPSSISEGRDGLPYSPP